MLISIFLLLKKMLLRPGQKEKGFEVEFFEEKILMESQSKEKF